MIEKISMTTRNYVNMISDDEDSLWMGKFVSVPKDMGSFNCHAFLAGIVRGVLDTAGFTTTRYVVICDVM